MGLLWFTYSIYEITFVDYDDGYAIMEFIGEWNDCITNDIMFLKEMWQMF